MNNKVLKTIGRIIAWFFSVMFIIGSFSELTAPVSSVILITATLFILPPSSDYICRKFNFKTPSWAKVLIAIVALTYSNRLSEDHKKRAFDRYDTLVNSETSDKENKAITVTVGESNALKAAKRYLRSLPFSYDGLVKQLEYDKYSYYEATYAADNCGANWDEQARRHAKRYVKTMPFSRQGLIDQLIYDGYTESQALLGAIFVGY